MVKLLMTCTVDGKIAKDSKHFTNWSGSEDKKYFKRITKECGVIIMGNNTFKLFKNPLQHRLNVVYTRQKISSNYLNVLYTNDPPKILLNKLKKLGYSDVCLIGGSKVNTIFTEYIDEIHLTIVPKLFGNGISLFTESTNIDTNLKLKDMIELGSGNILMIYTVVKSEKNVQIYPVE